LIQEARDLYEGEATRRGIEIRLELQRAHDRNASIYISRRHLQFAINNLLHNSIKYSFRGNSNRRRHVTISGQPDGNYYRLSFTNFGVGILPEEISCNSIFKDGYQGKLTKDEYRSGSGKGLYFVKRIIDRHKGRIEVDSRLRADEETPEGKPHLNRFTIYLPFEAP
jgi:signal transduction histidine kinase